MNRPSDFVFEKYYDFLDLKEKNPDLKSQEICELLGISNKTYYKAKNWIDKGVNMRKPSDDILNKYEKCKKMKELDPSKSINSILKECNISAGSFYDSKNWEHYELTGELNVPAKRVRRSFKSPKQEKPSMVTIPVVESSKLVALIGSHEQVISAIRELI